EPRTIGGFWGRMISLCPPRAARRWNLAATFELARSSPSSLAPGGFALDAVQGIDVVGRTCDRRRAEFDKVGLCNRQSLNKVLDARDGKTLESVLVKIVRRRPHVLNHGKDLIREINQIGAAVAGRRG